MSFLTRSIAILLVFSQALFSAEASANYLLPSSILLKPHLVPGTPGQEPTASVGLHILVIDSEDGINIIKKKTAVRPVVEVRDRNNLPVAGVLVTFSSPTDGPSVVFSNGARSTTAITDAQGRAVAPQSTPVNPGSFQLDVSLSYNSERASITIPMNNVMSAAPGTATGATAAHGLSGTTIAIIVGVAAAAAVGLAIGLSQHGSATAPTTVTIAPGSGVTAGAP